MPHSPAFNPSAVFTTNVFIISSLCSYYELLPNFSTPFLNFSTFEILFNIYI